MSAARSTSFDVDTLHRALERGEPGVFTDLFKDDAEFIVIDKDNPPSRPLQRRGKEEIGELNDYLLGPGKTHHVENLIVSDDRIAFADACRYDDGTRVYCNAFLELEGGKIRREVCVQAWDD